MATARSHYDMLDKLREVLEQDHSVNTVTYGDIYSATNDKTTMFPLSHFTVNNVDLNKQTYTFNMTLFCMDLIDDSKDIAEDKFDGNDNVKDIHNTQLAVISRAMLLFRRKDMINLHYSLVGEPRFEAFQHEFNENNVAGWYVDFSVEVMQDMNIGC
jgi:alpha-amylase/alpha-mannosidase (GH57 family)